MDFLSMYKRLQRVSKADERRRKEKLSELTDDTEIEFDVVEENFVAEDDADIIVLEEAVGNDNEHTDNVGDSKAPSKSQKKRTSKKESRSPKKRHKKSEAHSKDDKRSNKIKETDLKITLADKSDEEDFQVVDEGDIEDFEFVDECSVEDQVESDK